MTTNDLEIEAINRKKEIDEDHELARSTLRTMLQINQEMIPILSVVCKGSEHPRAFEVLSKLTKDTADIANTLLENQRRKQIVDTETAMDMIKAREESNSPPMLTATIVSEKRFIGTAEDMQKRIAAMKLDINEDA